MNPQGRPTRTVPEDQRQRILNEWAELGGTDAVAASIARRERVGKRTLYVWKAAAKHARAEHADLVVRVGDMERENADLKDRLLAAYEEIMRLRRVAKNRTRALSRSTRRQQERAS